MKFSLWSFWGALILYSLASVVFFVSTTSGWGVLYMPVILGIFYAGFLGFTLISSIVLYSAGIREVWISQIEYRILIAVHIVAGLLNFGDCGDSDGGGPFILRLLLPNDKICSRELFYSIEHAIVLGGAALLVVALTNIFVLGKIYWRSRSQSSSIANGIVAIYFVIVAFVLVSGGFIGWQYINTEYYEEVTELQMEPDGRYSNCLYTKMFVSPEGAYCRYLLEKHGYIFEEEKLGRYKILDRDFTWLDRITILF